MRKSLNVLITILVFTSITAAAFAGEAPASASAGVVNINTASASEIAMLPRVGVKAAQRVVDYRTEHGAFTKATDLMQVKGFGEKTFERLSNYITLDGKTTLSAKIRSPRKPRSTKASKSRPSTAS